MHLFLVVALVLPLTTVASSSQSSYMTIPALGRIAHFGYLYNEQTGELISSSVFRTSDLPSTSIVTTELHSTFTDAGITNTFAEKLQLLNIDVNTGANILSGLVKVRGSARILKDQQTNDEELTGILTFHHQTVDQDLQMFADALKDLYNKYLLNHREATHFVSGITWGLNAAVTFKGIATQYKTKADVRHELEEEFDALRENSLKVGNSKTNFSMLVYSDVALPISQKPTNLRELHEFKNQIPQAIRSTNDGRGIPIQYKLTPISAIRNYLNVSDLFNVFARDISDLTLSKFFPIFDEISSTEQQLKTVREKLESNLNCVHQDTRDQIIDLNLNFTEFKKTFEKTFEASLLSVRGGNGTSNELVVLAKSFRFSGFSGIQMRRTLAEFKNALDKIDFCNNLKSLNAEIEYFGAIDNLSSKILENREKTIFSFFYKLEFIQNDAAAFYHHLNIFLSFRDTPNSKLFAVDCDFDFSLCESVSNTTIRQFVNGIITSPDFVQETKFQETKFEEQIRQLNENLEAVRKTINTTVDAFRKNQETKLEEHITQVTSRINLLWAAFVDLEDFKSHQQFINMTVEDIQTNLRDINAHNKIVNATIKTLQDNLGGLNATVQESWKHLGNVTAQQTMLKTDVGEIQNSVVNLGAVQNVMNTTAAEFRKNQENKLKEHAAQVGSQINSLNAVFVDSENFRANQIFINTTMEGIQDNLREFSAQQTVLATNLGNIQTNFEILQIQDTALNSTCEANRKEIRNLHNKINTINENCNPNKCKNGGTCVIGFKSFTCICPPNYTGTTCQMDVDECLETPNLCQNGGTCRNSNGSYSCDCTSEWTGPHCETDFDYCFNVTCLNGGTCHDRVGDFFCECLPEFDGRTCSQRSLVQCSRSSSSSRVSVNRQNSGLVTLNCSGLVSLPPQGSSILLEYKSNVIYNNNERCLWTLDSLHRNSGRKYWGMELKVTMLCDGFGNSRDVLTLHALTHNSGNYRHAYFSSHLMQKNKSFQMLLSGSYLSFTSDRSTTGYGFVVEIEVVRLDAGFSSHQYAGQNYFYSASQGTFTHGPYAPNEQVSIGINSFASTTLTVNYIDTEGASDCSYDALNIFEIQESGLLFIKGRLCGYNKTLPLVFTTADPILAVFTSDHSLQGRGFQMTWT